MSVNVSIAGAPTPENFFVETVLTTSSQRSHTKAPVANYATVRGLETSFDLLDQLVSFSSGVRCIMRFTLVADRVCTLHGQNVRRRWMGTPE